MEFTILGPTRLHVQGVQADLGPTKQRGLLALLLHDVNNSVPIDTLVGELWSPDRTFEQVRRSFHALVSRLRGALEKATAPARIERDGEAYRISMDPALIDLHRFRSITEQASESAARNDHTRACSLLKGALALWAPMPLAEVKGSWADQLREQLETFDRLPAHLALFDSQLALGENNEVLRGVAALVRRHELNEELVLRRLRAFAGLGRVADALRVYHGFAARIADELGIDPGPDLRALHAALLRSEQGSAVHTQLTVHARSTRQLPRPAPDFVGRTELLARLDALVANGDAAGSHRICTLHGMPGIGKTSLAVHWLDRNRERFPDGRFSLDLRGYGPGAPLAPEDALSVLLLSLGVEAVPKSVDERQARLRNVLGDKKIALLFDNAKDASQVKPLLAAAPDCVILITSRDLLAELNVHEHAESMTVSPLDAEESLALLASSLGPVRAAEDHAAMRHLASLTSGLPLGLRIVTQRVVERPHTRLVDLARELQRQDVLGAIGTGDEAATLAAPFSWSYQALSPAAAGTFAALGLLPGADFSADAVCALLNAERSEVDQNLRALVRVNLLQHGAGRSFRLHQLLHGYATQLAERTEAVPDARAAQRRLLDWLVLSLAAGYRRLVPSGAEIPPLPDPAPVQPMTFEDDSAVIGWAAESAALSAAVAISRRRFPEHCWRLAAYAQEVMDRLRMHTELLAIHRTGLDAARELGNSEAECGMQNDLGMINHRLGKYAEAEAALRRALTIATTHGLGELLPIVLSNLASVHMATGDLANAVGLYEKALSAVQEIGTQNTEAVVIDQLANAYRKLGRDDKALELYRRALSIREDIGHTRGMGTTLAEMAILLHEHGKNSEALILARKALALNIRSGDRVRVAETQVALAEIHYDFGSFDNTISWADRSLGLSETAKSPDLQARALRIRGYALAALDDHDSARSSWHSALNSLLDAGTPYSDRRVAQLRRLLRRAAGDTDPGDPEAPTNGRHGA